MLVPLVCYLFAWASYNSAIAVAHRFCEALSVAFDLHHLQLWEALSQHRLEDIQDERDKAVTLSVHLDGSSPCRSTLLSLPGYQSVQHPRRYTISQSTNQGRPHPRPVGHQ